MSFDRQCGNDLLGDLSCKGSEKWAAPRRPGNNSELYQVLPLYLFYQVKREDLQGKQILATNEKYDIADHGIREAVFSGNMRDINLILENIVYLELLRRGFPKYVVSLDEFDMSRNGEYSCVKNVIPVQWGSSAIIRIVYVSAVWFFSTFQSPLLYSNKNLI